MRRFLGCLVALAALGGGAAGGGYTTDGSGFIPYWLGVGPVPVGAARAGGKALDEPELKQLAASSPAPGDAIEMGGRQLKWKLVTVRSGTAVVDGDSALGKAENAAGVILAYVVLGKDEPAATIFWGSDDSAALYVNGKEVSRFVGGRGAAPDQNKAEKLELRRGVNRIALLILNGAREWGGCARLAGSDGKPLKGLRLLPAPDGRKVAEADLWKLVTTGQGPRVFADQIGYRTAGRKLLVVASSAVLPDGLTLELVDAKTEKAAWRLSDNPAALAAFNNGQLDKESGDYIAHLDLSGFKTPGRYYVKMTCDGETSKSLPFNIADRVHRAAGLAAWRSYYFQRADTELPERFAGPWAHKASHRGPNQSTQARVYKWTGAAHWDPVGKEVLDPTPHDVSGGWWDAGNFDKYMGNTTVCHLRMLLGIQLVGDAAKGVELNTPESGDDVPDLLDEARWGTEWFLRMADDTGAAWGRVFIPTGCPPESVTGPTMLTVQTSGATMNRIANLAYAAMVWTDLKLDPAFARTCLDEAMKSWKLLEAKPHPWPADPKDPRKPAKTGEWYSVDYNACRAIAAACLFRLTRDKAYEAIAREWLSKVGSIPPGDNWEAVQAAWVYIHAPGADAALVQKLRKALLDSGDAVVKASGPNRGYCAGIRGYWWGSNALVGSTGLAAAVAAELADEPDAKRRYLEAAEEYAHYLFGRNPLGLCYLTNMKEFGAENSVMVMFHAWLGNAQKANDPYGGKFIGSGPGKVGPPPGYVVGGANGHMKRYVAGLNWWENPWEFNEPCLNYQGPCASLLAYLALKAK